MEKLVFVYGTLKPGHNNNKRILSTTEHVGSATTLQKFVLTTVGFPYMIPESVFTEDFETLRVFGDVYRVKDQDVMDALDRLEGVAGGHYKHHNIKVFLGGGVQLLDCLCYVPCNSLNALQNNLCLTTIVDGEVCYVY